MHKESVHSVIKSIETHKPKTGDLLKISLQYPVGDYDPQFLQRLTETISKRFPGVFVFITPPDIQIEMINAERLKQIGLMRVH